MIEILGCAVVFLIYMCLLASIPPAKDAHFDYVEDLETNRLRGSGRIYLETESHKKGE